MRANILLVLIVVSLVGMSGCDTLCWSNGHSCADGGCFRRMGRCGTVARRPDGRPICRCSFGL